MNIQEAKQIKIADYLQSLGYSPVKQQGNCLWYKSPFRQETEASFKVNTDRNLWFDYGLGRGGNIIAQFSDTLLVDAVEEVVDGITYRRPGMISVDDYLKSKGEYIMIEQLLEEKLS